MSNQTNDKLLEEAQMLIDYWEGTLHAEILRNDIENNDLENLFYHVDDARHEMLGLEYNPEEVYGRAEDLRDSMREDGLIGANDVY